MGVILIDINGPFLLEGVSLMDFLVIPKITVFLLFWRSTEGHKEIWIQVFQTQMSYSLY